MTLDREDAERLKAAIKAHGASLGFDAVAIAGVDLAEAEAGLAQWLAAGFQGEMDYMVRHGAKRARPAELVPGTVSIIAARINYLAQPIASLEQRLLQPGEAYVSVYAHGRDYHKVVRAKLQKLAELVRAEVGVFGYRAFTDSAPVMEVAIAAQAGLGWRGKHTLLLDRGAGSFFFLGEIYTDLALPPDQPVEDHCGTCFACAEVCPTGAIVGPYQLDARRCISYLTIELNGAIPEALRPLVGNRVYGCDDCQLACPWNKFAQITQAEDFRLVRNGLDRSSLVELFSWSEVDFRERMAGSAIYRIGYAKWLSNLAIGMGNALRQLSVADGEASEATTSIRRALALRADSSSALVRECVAWALAQPTPK